MLSHSEVANNRMDPPQLAETLPSASETTQVFKDFRAVLRVARYHTPMQRVNRLHCHQSSLSLFSKQSAETENVFNLLQPGHNTCLSVDFLRVIADMGQHCYIRIPVTLLNRAKEVVLLKNNSAGQVMYKVLPSIKAATPALSREIGQTGLPKPFFPRYLHKSLNSRTSLLASASEIPPLWLATAPNPQCVQQFIQPFTKTASLVRAHWRVNRKVATFYFLSRGPARRNTKPCITAQVPDLGMARSFSVVKIQEMDACVTRASSNLVVRKAKAIPELDRTLEEVVRVLTVSLRKGRKVVETVCDFICNSQHQWVFIGCQGFIFESECKLRTKTLEPTQPINLNFLMYPLIARKSQIKQRLANKLRAATGLFNRRDALLGSFSHLEDYIKPETSDSSPLLPPPEPKEEPVVSAIPMLEREILTREVNRLEKLLQGSRKYKQVQKSTIDVVQKYGGKSRWRPILQSLYKSFYCSPDIAVYFEEQVGFEECAHMLNVIMRILRGDYNFYYQEALRKLHAKHCIAQTHYQFFVSTMRGMIEDAGISRGDVEIVMERFSELGQYICTTRVK